MEKIKPFIRLDFITVKPYFTLKYLLIFAAACFVVTLSSPEMGIPIFIIYSTISAVYPFAVSEKSAIENLYISLSVKRETVVLGRYLFTFTLDVLAVIIAFIYSYLVYIIFVLLNGFGDGFDAKKMLIIVTIMLMVCTLIQAIQLPIFFKIGYARAKFLSYLPFMAMFILAALIVKDVLTNENSWFIKTLGWIGGNQILAGFAGVAAWFAIMIVSYRLSVVFYKKRDF